MSETRLTTNGPPVHTTTTTAVTAEPPTECSTPRLRGRILGPNRHTCKEVNEKDARIRELEGVLIGIKDTLRALARSEGGGA